MENSGIKAKIAMLNLMQFAALGAWLPTIGSYVKQGTSTLSTMNNGDLHVAAILALPALVSLFMPVFMGRVADKWIQAQRLMSLCHICAAGLLFAASFMVKFPLFYCMMALALMFYMPTIALNNSVAYNALYAEEMDPVKHFPALRIWGYVGFLTAMWTTDLLGASDDVMQLWIAAGLSIITAFVAFDMPSCHIRPVDSEQEAAGTEYSVFAMFKRKNTAVFFICAMLLAMLLKTVDVMPSGIESRISDPTILISIHLLAACFAVIFIPSILRSFGIRVIAIVSLLACALSIYFLSGRGFLTGAWSLVAGMALFGIAAELFNVAGSLFVWMRCPSNMNSRAQGLFMMMTSGLGVACGTLVAYLVSGTGAGLQGCWYIFALCAVCLAVAFPFLYKSSRRRA